MKSISLQLLLALILLFTGVVNVFCSHKKSSQVQSESRQNLADDTSKVVEFTRNLQKDHFLCLPQSEKLGLLKV